MIICIISLKLCCKCVLKHYDQTRKSKDQSSEPYPPITESRQASGPADPKFLLHTYKQT